MNKNQNAIQPDEVILASGKRFTEHTKRSTEEVRRIPHRRYRVGGAVAAVGLAAATIGVAVGINHARDTIQLKPQPGIEKGVGPEREPRLLKSIMYLGHEETYDTGRVLSDKNLNAESALKMFPQVVDALGEDILPKLDKEIFIFEPNIPSSDVNDITKLDTYTKQGPQQFVVLTGEKFDGTNTHASGAATLRLAEGAFMVSKYVNGTKFTDAINVDFTGVGQIDEGEELSPEEVQIWDTKLKLDGSEDLVSTATLANSQGEQFIVQAFSFTPTSSS